MTNILPTVELPVSLPDPRPSDPLEALSWLGETEEEVVRALRERGIKGKRLCSKGCLIANYLSLWWEDVSVGPFDFGNRWFSYNTPPIIASVIDSFDHRRYPDLIAD